MFSLGITNATYNIGLSKSMLEKYSLQLETGKRINKAADDSSGLAIADKLRAQASGLAQGTKNANDAMGILNIMDSALSTYKDTLVKIREKAMSSASDGQSPESRAANQADVNNFLKSLQMIAKTTEFNGIKLLNGRFTNKSFQVGAFSNQTVGISVQSVETQKVGHLTETIGAKVSAGTTAATLTINGTTIAQSTVSGTTKDGANLIAEAINDKTYLTGVKAQAKNEVVGSSVTGGYIADGDLSINGVSIGAVNVTANDASGTLVQAINAKTGQTGVSASIDGNGALRLTALNGENIHITEANGGAAKAGLTAGTNYGQVYLTSSGGISIQNATAVSGLDSTTTNNYTLADLDVTTKDGAEKALDILDSAITEINRTHSEIGATTNQLERVIAVNNVTETNVKAAESQIRDVDLAEAQENMAKWQLKNQAAMFAFTLSKQNMESILSLLR